MTDFEIINIDPDPEYLNALDFMHREFCQPDKKGPLILGGAVTAFVYNQVVRHPNHPKAIPNDLDIFINPADTIFADGIDYTEKANATDIAYNLSDALRDHPDTSEFQIKEHVYAWINGGVSTLTYAGQKIDVIGQFRENNPEDAAQHWASVPMDAFVMDRHGTIYAHKDAMSHLVNRVYRIDAYRGHEIEYYLMRFDKKKTQYPGLKAILPPSVKIPEEYKNSIIPPSDNLHKTFADPFWNRDIMPGGKSYEIPNGLKPF